MSPNPPITPFNLLALAPWSDHVTQALQASAFGPFAVQVCADPQQLRDRLDGDAVGTLDVLIYASAADASAEVEAEVAAVADALAVLVVLPQAPSPEVALDWLQRGVQEVMIAAELNLPTWPMRVRAAIERKKLEREARRAYSTDLDTGLPHQQQLIEHMSQLIALREREPSPMAVLVLRIEGLASTEARLGAPAAATLRRKLAVRLRAGVRASDVVASIGDDSFAVLLGALLAPGDAVQVGAKLVTAVTVPFKVMGQEVAVAVALGMAQHPKDGTQPEALLRSASALAASATAQGRAGFANFIEAGGAPAAANDG